MKTAFTLDAYAPEEIAERVACYGVPRAQVMVAMMYHVIYSRLMSTRLKS
jgi:hypothetical protein